MDSLATTSSLAVLAVRASHRPAGSGPRRPRLAGRLIAVLVAVSAAGLAGTPQAVSAAARAGRAGATATSAQLQPPLPVRRLGLDEVTPMAPWHNMARFAHRPFERLRPGEWRVVGPPFGDVDAGVMGRSIDGDAVVTVRWSPHTALSDGTLEFDLRLRPSAPAPPLGAAGGGEAQAFVDGDGPWKLFTLRPEVPAFIMTSSAVINWEELPDGLRMMERDDCRPGAKGCVREVLQCGRRTLTLEAPGLGPYTFDLRANPAETLFHHMGYGVCRGGRAVAPGHGKHH